jgi:hypothetical protein
LVPIERAPPLVALDDVLVELGAEVFEDEAQMSEYRIVSEDTVPALD